MCACGLVRFYVLGVFDLSTLRFKLFFQHMLSLYSTRPDSLQRAAFICACYRISNELQSEYVNGEAFKLFSISNSILFQFQAHHHQLRHRLSGDFACHKTARAAIARTSTTKKHRAAASQLRHQIRFTWEIKHIHRGAFLLLVEQCRFESAAMPHQSVPRWWLDPPFTWN